MADVELTPDEPAQPRPEPEPELEAHPQPQTERQAQTHSRPAATAVNNENENNENVNLINTDEAETETALQPGWNPLHHIRLAWLLFRDARRIRQFRMGANKRRRLAIREVGKWVVSTAIWLPLFLYSLFIPTGAKLTPYITTTVFAYFEYAFVEVSNPVTVRLFILPAWIWGGLFGARRGRKSQILFGLPMTFIAFIVTDFIIGSLPKYVWACAAAAGVLALAGGIALGMARITRCQAAMAYTLAVCFIEAIVITATAALDMNGGKQFVAAATFTMLSTAVVWAMTKLFFPVRWKDIGEILTLFVFSGTWIGSFLKAALSARGDILWAGGAALVVALVAFLMFLRGVYSFIRIYEDDEVDEQKQMQLQLQHAPGTIVDGEREEGAANTGSAATEEYEYVFEEGWDGVLLDTSSDDESDSDGDLTEEEARVDAEAEAMGIDFDDVGMDMGMRRGFGRGRGKGRGRGGLRPLADKGRGEGEGKDHSRQGPGQRQRRLSNPFPIVSSANVWPRREKPNVETGAGVGVGGIDG